MQRWESWSGLETAQPAQVLTPTSPTEVVDAVVAARTHGLTVKMVGSGHSFTGIAVETDCCSDPTGWWASARWTGTR